MSAVPTRTVTKRYAKCPDCGKTVDVASPTVFGGTPMYALHGQRALDSAPWCSGSVQVVRTTIETEKFTVPVTGRVRT